MKKFLEYLYVHKFHLPKQVSDYSAFEVTDVVYFCGNSRECNSTRNFGTIAPKRGHSTLSRLRRISAVS